MCVCGDILTNHRITQKMIDGKKINTHHECEVDGCECEQYVFDKLEHHGQYARTHF